MKYIVIILFFLVACNKQKHVEYKFSPSDTTQTTAIFLAPDGNVHVAIVYRLTQDYADYDSSNLSGWKRDTFYYVPAIDTLFDSKGHAIIDSITHLPKQGIVYNKTDKKFILQDFNKSFDK